MYMIDIRLIFIKFRDISLQNIFLDCYLNKTLNAT